MKYAGPLKFIEKTIVFSFYKNFTSTLHIYNM